MLAAGASLAGLAGGRRTAGGADPGGCAGAGLGSGGGREKRGTLAGA
jgi:hypothetical protein